MVLEGNADLDTLSSGTEQALDVIDTADLDGFEITVTGSPVFLKEINDYLRGGMLTLGALALAVMAVILFVLFRVRWRSSSAASPSRASSRSSPTRSVGSTRTARPSRTSTPSRRPPDSPPDLDRRIAGMDLPEDSILLQDLEADEPPMRAVPAGLAVVGTALLENLSANRASLTYLGLALAALFLLIRFRSLGRAALTLVPVGLAIGTSSVVIGLVGLTLSPLTTAQGAGPRAANCTHEQLLATTPESELLTLASNDPDALFQLVAEAARTCTVPEDVIQAAVDAGL